MKTIVKTVIVNSLMVFGLLIIASCEKEDEKSGYIEETIEILEVSNTGISEINEVNLKSTIVETPDLTNEEIDMLLIMKDEEKLARDVYNALYEKWDVSIFLNISEAEEKHLNAIIILLENYNSDYTQIAEQGVFDNDEFKILYDELVKKGTDSIVEAYKIGALIEELDINDLQQYLTQTENENIILVFNNLLKGSRNHLRAFDIQLSNLGIDYVPQYISQSAYDEIVSSPFEKGNQYQKNNNGGINGKGRKSRKGNNQGQNGGGLRDGSCGN